jgi:phospholipid/cholesterol/gamma-HCH transport system substrate-binding protein
VQSLKRLKNSRTLRSPVTWGAGAIAFAVVVALVSAYLYYHPPGRDKVFAFYTTDAASVRVGEEVRMAGIAVGKVEKLQLQPDQVKVTARVADDAFVGDRSQIDVRMLTVVGGYYVNVASIGDRPLGDNVIPSARVKMPYNLIQALTETTKITEHVNTAPLNESLNQIQHGLSGVNTEVISTVINAGNAIMSAVDQQRGQVTEILNMSDEYIRAMSQYRDKFIQLVNKISIVTQIIELYQGGVSSTITGLGHVLESLKPVADLYLSHRPEFVEKIRTNLDRGRAFVERNGLTIRALKRIQNLMDRVLDAQNARPALLATDLCMPTPGNPC